MKRADSTESTRDSVWARYLDNFPRQVLGVNRFLETHVMSQLTGEHNFADLRVQFEPYISLAGPDGVKLSDIAVALRISRQAVNQSVSQIEASGYIERIPDHVDGRSKLIVLTARGKELHQRGLEVAQRLELEFRKILGNDLYNSATKSLSHFCKVNDLLPPSFTSSEMSHAPIVVLLPRFSQYISERLMELTIDRGHSQLKLSYIRVLALIGPDGGRIRQIAELQNVSKQAISQIASELEDMGYIHRDPDPANARQVVLRFTRAGRQLIEDSVKCIGELELEIGSCIGQKNLTSLSAAMKSLYHTLQPERPVFLSDTPCINTIASELRRKLHPDAIQQLAAILQDNPVSHVDYQ